VIAGLITPGEWALETVATSIGLCHKIGPFPGSNEDKPTTHACIYGDQLRVGIDDELPRAKELLANARLFAEAGTVTNETGLSPRQLADERDKLKALNAELAAALKLAVSDLRQKIEDGYGVEAANLWTSVVEAEALITREGEKNGS
jgi:hypothetical protein